MYSCRVRICIYNYYQYYDILYTSTTTTTITNTTFHINALGMSVWSAVRLRRRPVRGPFAINTVTLFAVYYCYSNIRKLRVACERRIIIRTTL